ncbi:MAG: aspartate-semialdehyde dehydrogenase [Nitrospirae bacterium]|nr:aspartate-semialdehyde dehydrogenase [Candidatus Manganitrophaceae bacterium]
MLQKKENYRVAIIGATGAVGEEMMEILASRKFPLESLKLFASERSEGKIYDFLDDELRVEILDQADFSNIDIVLGATSADLARIYTPKALKAGSVIIDNSSAFRMEPLVPLIVPEVNGDLIATHQGIIANPNCSTAQLVVALKPLHDAARLSRVIVTTFQSVSGTGKNAIDELLQQTKDILSFKTPERNVYSEQIAFNCIVDWARDPETGDTEEELKIIEETRKIMGEPDLPVTATTVRVPVFRSHGESVTIETEKKLSLNEARALLSEAPGLTVLDDPARKVYPTPLDTADQDNVYVGRVREDRSCKNGLHLWVVADNLRKGAALNAIQIAEGLIR